MNRIQIAKTIPATPIAAIRTGKASTIREFDPLTSDRFAITSARQPASPAALSADARRRDHNPAPRASDLKKKMTAIETMNCSVSIPMLDSVPIQVTTTA
jgi:hypothetical protein